MRTIASTIRRTLCLLRRIFCHHDYNYLGVNNIARFWTEVHVCPKCRKRITKRTVIGLLKNLRDECSIKASDSELREWCDLGLVLINNKVVSFDESLPNRISAIVICPFGKRITLW
jgi:NAD-dependent SIR2 family protein deacetylase